MTLLTFMALITWSGEWFIDNYRLLLLSTARLNMHTMFTNTSMAGGALCIQVKYRFNT